MFNEIFPVKPRSETDTGVAVKLTESWGLTITLGYEALEIFKGGDNVKVFTDLDPAFPRIRLVSSEDGKFCLQSGPALKKESLRRFVRIGRRDEFKATPETAAKLACIWSQIDGNEKGIDIELPREFRRSEQVNTKHINSKGDVTAKSVSLAPVRR